MSITFPGSSSSTPSVAATYGDDFMIACGGGGNEIDLRRLTVPSDVAVPFGTSPL